MEWRIIKDFPNYKVNNEGQIKSLNYNHTNREQLLKEFIGSKGYPYVILVNKGKRFYKTIHSLVAQAFTPNPNNYNSVNHKDEDKLNNNVNNLEWLNLEDNIRYGTGIERRAIKQRTDYRSRKVKSIDTFGNVTTYNSAREASRVTGVNQGSISKCCNGLRVSAGLYKWSYE